jgi:hypothetical protein
MLGSTTLSARSPLRSALVHPLTFFEALYGLCFLALAALCAWSFSDQSTWLALALMVPALGAAGVVALARLARRTL